MAEEFPGNSNRDKERPKQARREPEKKIERVTQGRVQRRKKPLLRRMKEIFFGGEGVWDFLANTVIVPSMQDIFHDVITQGAERMIYRDDYSPGGRRRYHRRDPRGHVRYDRYSSRHDEPRNISRRGRASHNFDEIILDSRIEAEEVIDSMFELIQQFEEVTVADLYELVGITGNYTDQKWGWDDLTGAGATRLSGGGYLLDLPKPIPLD